MRLIMYCLGVPRASTIIQADPIIKRSTPNEDKTKLWDDSNEQLDCNTQYYHN